MFKRLGIIAILVLSICQNAYATCGKVTDCVALTSVADGDLSYIVDISDTTIAATGSGKKITRSNYLKPNLMAIDGVTSAADKLFYFTGSGAGAVTSFTSAGRALIDDADTTAQRVTLGLVIGTNVQAQDTELAALAGLTSAADKIPYFTGSGTAALADFTSTARSLVDDTSTSAMRTTLGVAIGSNVQAYSANLDAVAAVTVTAAGTALLDDANAAAQRTTLGLGTIATQASSSVSITGGAISGTTIAGATAGSFAGAGFVGEILQANLVAGSAITTNTGVNTDIVSLAYTAGNWWVSIKSCTIYGTSTSTAFSMFGGTATGDNQTGATNYNTFVIEHPTAGSSGTACGSVAYPLTASGSGTVYLKAINTFTVGTATAYGTISMFRLP